MVINWYGQNCFKLQQGDLVILVDPPLKESGLRSFRGRIDIIIRTSVSLPFGDLSKKEEEAFEINHAGEYEVKNVFIQGWPIKPQTAKNKERKTEVRSVYLIKIEDLRIVLLGYLTDAVEVKDFQEYLEGAEIVFVPADGENLIDESAAAKLIRQLKPRLVIPTLFEKQEKLKSFLKELGKNNIAPQEKIIVSKKDLAKEELTIGCLKV